MTRVDGDGTRQVLIGWSLIDRFEVDNDMHDDPIPGRAVRIELRAAVLGEWLSRSFTAGHQHRVELRAETALQ